MGGESEYVGDGINPKTFSTVKYIDDSMFELVNSNKGLKLKKDSNIIVLLKVTNTKNCTGSSKSACYLNGNLVTQIYGNNKANEFFISTRNVFVSADDVITIGAIDNMGYNATQLLIIDGSVDANFSAFVSSYLFDGIQ